MEWPSLFGKQSAVEVVVQSPSLKEGRIGFATDFAKAVSAVYHKPTEVACRTDNAPSMSQPKQSEE